LLKVLIGYYKYSTLSQFKYTFSVVSIDGHYSTPDTDYDSQNSSQNVGWIL